MPTGILKEKAFPTIDIGAYDGTIQDSNEVNSSVFLRAYGTLRRAHIDTLIALDTLAITHLADTMNDYLLAGKVPIAILNYTYSCIKDSALADDLLSMDEFEISDVSGRPASPYENHTCFVAAPAISRFDSLQVTFIVPSHLYLSNDSREIDFVEIDFGNGEGYQTVTFDENIIILYDTVATVQMLIRVHFTNSDILEAKNVLSLEDNSDLYEMAANSETHAPIVADLSYEGGYGKVVYFVHYACNNTEKKLKRPFIVTTGFVPVDVAVKQMTTGVYQTGASYFSDLKTLNEDFYFKRIEQEYDIIYVNFYNPTDYIQRNAYAFEKLIQWVNEQKALNGSTAPNVVLGTSMGGLVAAYALAHMHKLHEDNPTTVPDHDTRLLYTHDSPLKGVNTPIGVQRLVKASCHYYFNLHKIPLSELPGLQNDYLTITCRAAQQMLINNIFSNNLRSDLVSQMTSFGDLNNIGCKVIAISNGSGDGVVQGNGIYGQGSWDPLLPNTIISNYYLNNNKKGVMRWVELFNLYSAPITTSSHYRVLEWHIDIKLFDKQIMFYHSSAKAAPNHRNGLDGMPGSIGKQDALAAKGITTILGNRYKYFYKYHCFIPTISAMNIENSLQSNFTFNVNSDRTKSKLNRYITHDDRPVPVDEKNGEHAKFNRYSITVFFQEMLNTTPAVIATGETYNYGLPVSDRIGDVTVNGTLAVNKNTKTGYSDDVQNTNTEPPNNTHFKVETLKINSSCSTKTNTITVFGELTIGDNGSSRTGELIIHSGSKLILKNGANVTLHNNSKLIIHENAELEVEDGVTFNLIDANSEVVIRGILTMQSNADIVLATGDGNLRFDCPENAYCSTQFVGNNTISLTGADRTDRVLVVEGKGVDLSDLTSFNITTGKVELGTNTEIVVDGSMALNTVKVTKASGVVGTNVHKGIVINSLTGKTISIQHSRFEYAQIGLTKSSTSTISPLSLTETTFGYCTFGLKTFGGGCTLSKVRFDNCGIGWKATDMSATSEFNGFAENNISAIEYAGNSSADLSVFESVFRDNKEDVFHLGTAITTQGDFDLNLACNHFIENDNDVICANGNLFLAGTNAGNNYFYNTLINTLYLDQVNSLTLVGGYNEFIYTTNPQKVFTGIINSGITSVSMGDNFWQMLDGSSNMINDLYTPLADIVNNSSNSITCSTATVLNTSNICTSTWDGLNEITEKIARSPKARPTSQSTFYVIYPNPASDQFYLKSASGVNMQNITMKAIDVMGKTIQLHGQGTYNLSHLATGMYQIIIEQNGHILYKQKLVVSR